MPRRGQYNVGGSVELEINGQMNHLLRHVFGTVTTAASGSYFCHTFKTGDLPTGLTIEKGFTDIGQYFRYNGCKINRFAMTLTADGMIKGSVDILGATESASAASFQSTPSIDVTHNPFDAYEITLQEAGVAIVNATAFDFAVDNNLDGNVYIIDGTGRRNSIPEGLQKVSGTLKCMFENLTMYNKALNLTESSLQVRLTHGTGDGSLNNEVMEIKIPEIYFATNAPVITGPTGVIVELPFTAFYDNSTEAAAIQVKVVNNRPNSTMP
jgi:hypothetical protein